jgi:hypothetical protein
MYELRSTRVRTDRVLSVPGTDFLCRLPPVRPQIASIPARLGQVPGTDFQPGPQIASIPPRPWQVPGTDFHLPPRPGQVPGTDFHLAPIWPHRLGRSIDTLGSEPQATVDPLRRMPGVLGAPGTGFLVLTDRTD